MLSAKIGSSLIDGDMGVKNFLFIMLVSFALAGCGEKNDAKAIEAVIDYVSKNDDGTSELQNLKFYPDDKKSEQAISGYVCGNVNITMKDKSKMSYPFYSHVFISGETKNVTDTHALFSNDEDSVLKIKSRCK